MPLPKNSEHFAIFFKKVLLPLPRVSGDVAIAGSLMVLSLGETKKKGLAERVWRCWLSQRVFKRCRCREPGDVAYVKRFGSVTLAGKIVDVARKV